MTTDHSFFLRGHLLKVSKDADQAELVALRLGKSRATSGVRDDSIADTLEESYAAEDGLGEEAWQSLETSMDTASSQILEELERRSKALGELYPFRLDGDVLTYEQSDSLVYEFLLCTSLTPSLTTGRFKDFPRQFERLATVLTANFLGPNTGHCHIGFPNENKRFKKAVGVAIANSGELRWQPDDDLPDEGPRQGDEGVDYIVWKDFGCGRAIGQPFYFGQCACGNDWDGKLNDVSEKFFKWFSTLKVSPAKVFAVPFVIPDNKLKEVARDAGIVMDRLRLVRAVAAGEHFDLDLWKEKLFETMCLVAAA
ncbi:hypothetical protein ASD8599_01092 [Ascidiaceihabitans donghaensis]|uniref:Uncharacterized protein n=1 Tax=Ascidiaceihabitans donghaensis TaxID=1510460 RepID=A0A2R8BBR1_9RHOB|nr:hypothetical protein [Ascidiaceihabitans donghaensis]SPH20356.1 hypothetical protein ASD8599_01092 [Ascidiaceihabitans donghaensis]